MKRDLGEPVRLWDHLCFSFTGNVLFRGGIGDIVWYRLYITLYENLTRGHYSGIAASLQGSIEHTLRQP